MELLYKHDELAHNTRSAKIISKLIYEELKPISILDVGCGIGTWLCVFKSIGVKEVLGIDGDYVDRELLKKYIDDSEFKSIDLRYSFDLKKKFDLVISLEVAKHLPFESADNFIDSICRHGDTVLFSAALPGQGGKIT